MHWQQGRRWEQTELRVKQWSRGENAGVAWYMMGGFEDVGWGSSDGKAEEA
jgi:hypothetical protein